MQAKEEEVRIDVEEKQFRARMIQNQEEEKKAREEVVRREAEQTLLQTSTPRARQVRAGGAEGLQLCPQVTGQVQVSEEEYLQMLREREEYLGEEQDTSTKKYFITQQEIVFYVKDSEGVVRIIHRPLLRKEEMVEGRMGRRRSLSLGRSEVVRQEEGSSHIQIHQVGANWTFIL